MSKATPNYKFFPKQQFTRHLVLFDVDDLFNLKNTDDLNVIASAFEAAAKKIRKHISLFPDAKGDLQYGYETCLQVIASYQVEETDEEYQTRLRKMSATLKEAAEKKMKKELKELARLKKKYENNV